MTPQERHYARLGMPCPPEQQDDPIPASALIAALWALAARSYAAPLVAGFIIGTCALAAWEAWVMP